jgi:ubiquinone/menaquinone biosynthesis C-methylase UbiE
VYRQKDSSPGYARQYSPMDQIEFGYHLEQLRALGELLREAGCNSLAGIRVLDVGCGSGRLLGDLIGLGAEPADLVGVDLSSERIAAASRRHPGIRFLRVDGGALPFDARSFDLVLQSVVFSSIHSAALRCRLADEITRVLDVGGHVFWWDLPYLVDCVTREPLVAHDLFPGLQARIRHASWLPQPSSGLRRRLWRCTLGRVIDCFGGRLTHVAALFGPQVAG